MKRLCSMLVIGLLMMNLLTMPAMAAGGSTAYTISYEDGSYAVVEVCNHNSARANKDSHKNYTFYNPQGQRCFTYTLYAVFTYNGTTSRADSCDYSVAIYQRGWSLSTHSEYVSGSTAYGSATFSGPDGQSRTASLTLTCDKNGNVT